MELEYKSWDSIISSDAIVNENVPDRDTAIARVRQLARISFKDLSTDFSDIRLHHIHGDEGEDMMLWYDDEIFDCTKTII